MASGLTVNFECVVKCMLKFWSHDFPSLSGKGGGYMHVDSAHEM